MNYALLPDCHQGFMRNRTWDKCKTIQHGAHCAIEHFKLQCYIDPNFSLKYKKIYLKNNYIEDLE